MFIYKLFGDHEKLGKYEGETINKCKLWAIAPYFYTAKKYQDHNYALTKNIYKIIKKGKINNILKELQQITFTTKKTFMLKKEGTSSYTTKKLADQLQTEQKVNIKNPQIIYAIIFLENYYYFCEQIWENKDNYTKRKAHNRPRLHPSSLHPKIAKAMVNIANTKNICDPFCGSGGILIEACLLNKNVLGLDIKQHMLNMAKENLDFFNCKNYILKKQNALEYNNKTATIVTDVPYGKNTSITENLYKEFLQIYKHKTKKMVVAFPANIELKNELRDWKIAFTYTYTLHKSLGKTIYVLQI